MLNNIHIMKLEPRSAKRTTTFSMYPDMKTKPQPAESTYPRITFNERNLFSNAVDMLSKTMYYHTGFI